MQKTLNKLLQGQYSFKRIVLSPEMSFDGVANFIINSHNQIVYNEKGSCNKGITFQQKQFFQFGSSNLYIYKSDNSLLHQFSIDKNVEFPIVLNHTHHCGEDQYSLEMTIYSEDSFSTLYKINGPLKDYTIHTSFSRVV